MITTTETKVTNIRKGHGQLRNTGYGKCVIFIRKNNLLTLVDEWFNKNGIYALDYKCRTWNWLCKTLTKEVAAIIRAHFNLPEAVDINYSAYAGCTCPCSKGYVVKFDGVQSSFEHRGCWIHMDIFGDDKVVERVKIAIARADIKLQMEKFERANPPKPQFSLNLT